MTQAKNGDTVKVHYTGTLEDGTQFDSSIGSDPLRFTLGQGQLIPGFEKSVTGMAVGDKETITLPPEEAYGERREDLMVTIQKSQLPQETEPHVGMMLQAEQQDGSVVNFVIDEIGETTVNLDANPPLAGKTLIFEIELMEIV